MLYNKCTVTYILSTPGLPGAGEMAECSRQPVLEPYLVLLNDVRSSSHYVRSIKIFFNFFSAHINQLPSCFVLCLSLCVCLTRLTLFTFVYCAYDMIQLIYIFLYLYQHNSIPAKSMSHTCVQNAQNRYNVIFTFLFFQLSSAQFHRQ